MSLDFYLTTGEYEGEVFWTNTTHNLGRMASEACIYGALWRPKENGFLKASQVADVVEEGLALMKADPARFKAFNPENGWGSYDRFVPWLEDVLAACRQYPNADVRASV